jgi:hypothetical protein
MRIVRAADRLLEAPVQKRTVGGGQVILETVPPKYLGNGFVFGHVVDETNLHHPRLVFARIDGLGYTLAKWFRLLKEMNEIVCHTVVKLGCSLLCLFKRCM